MQPAAVSSIVGHAAHNKDATVTTGAYGISRVRYCVRVCVCVFDTWSQQTQFSRLPFTRPPGAGSHPLTRRSRLVPKHRVIRRRRQQDRGPLCVRRFLPSLRADRPTGNRVRSASAPDRIIYIYIQTRSQLTHAFNTTEKRLKQ